MQREETRKRIKTTKLEREKQTAKRIGKKEANKTEPKLGKRRLFIWKIKQKCDKAIN